MSENDERYFEQELSMEELDEIAGGKRHYGTWYEVKANDGHRTTCYSAEEANQYLAQHGGGSVTAVYGILSTETWKRLNGES